MPLRRLDHVNIRTAQLERLIAWYRDVLGLEPGPRPDFPFGGASLYCDGYPVVHLVETRSRHQGLDPTLEHFAFSAEDMDSFLAHLRAHRDERAVRGLRAGLRSEQARRRRDRSLNAIAGAHRGGVEPTTNGLVARPVGLERLRVR